MDAIRFGTDGWRATLDVFTEERVRTVGRAVAVYLGDEGIEGPVIVGYDARATSSGFADALAEELVATGRSVIRPDRDCPTPVVAWGILEVDAAGALMVTASHNPPSYNGVKFIPSDGAPALPDVTDAIESRLGERPTTIGESGAVRSMDLVDRHAEQAMELVGADLSGLTVAYDAMHGSGRGVTDALLERAGATVQRIRCERDETFGGTAPEPSPEHLEALTERVVGGEADLGIANDGDADRLAVVTPERGYLDENYLFAALYEHLLVEGTGPAVRTVSTSFLVDRVAEAHGEAVIETPVGFKWVAKAMGEHDALIGGEESGGFSVRGHVREKDGVLMALLAAAASAERHLDERVVALLSTHGEIHQDKVSVDCPESEKGRVIDALVDAVPERIAGEAVDRVNDADGLKVLLSDGSWLLVRPSGTEPKLRIYAEAGSVERVETLLAAGRDLVEPLVDSG